MAKVKSLKNHIIHCNVILMLLKLPFTESKSTLAESQS